MLIIPHGASYGNHVNMVIAPYHGPDLMWFVCGSFFTSSSSAQHHPRPVDERATDEMGADERATDEINAWRTTCVLIDPVRCLAAPIPRFGDIVHAALLLLGGAHDVLRDHVVDRDLA